MNTNYPRFVIESIRAPYDDAFVPNKARGRKTKPNFQKIQEILQRGKPDEVPDFAFNAQKAAIDDLLNLLTHVSALVDGPFADQYDLTTRLKEFRICLIDILDVIYLDGFLVGPYEDYEQLDYLLVILQEFSDVDFFADEIECDAAYELLIKLVSYWLCEIQKRGFHLLSLLTEPDYFHYEKVSNSFVALKSISYPRAIDAIE